MRPVRDIQGTGLTEASYRDFAILVKAKTCDLLGGHEIVTMGIELLGLGAVYDWTQRLTLGPGGEPPCIPPWKRGEFFVFLSLPLFPRGSWWGFFLCKNAALKRKPI